jgi:hypothetical protein
MDQFSSATWDDLVNDRSVPRRKRGSDFRTEVKKRTVELKSHAGCDRFPTDVQLLARAAGVREIRNVPLSMRGRLIREGSGIVAEINEDLPSRVRRFVIAHEIAHIILARDIARSGATSIYGGTGPKQNHAYVESLCDFGAREILLPENAVLKELRTNPLSLELIRNLATEADCDLEVVAECICGLPGRWRDLVFLFCTVSPAGADLRRMVSPKAATFELVDSEQALFRRSLCTTRALKGLQELWANYTKAIVSAEALALDPGHVILLFNSQDLQRASQS